MNGHLLDTNAISLFAPERQAPPEAFREWFLAQGDDVHFSAISVMEIQRGLHKLRRLGHSRKASVLDGWFAVFLGDYSDLILPFDTEVAMIAGRIDDRATGQGYAPGFAVAAIAATALRHDLILVTANTRHFTPFGVKVIDPMSM